MAHVRPLGAPLSRLATCAFAASRPEAQRLASVPYQSVRCASQATKAGAKKKKARNTFLQHDLKHAEQFSLVDAMQYIRAFEVGRDPSSSKYEMAVRLRTLRNGPVIRNTFRLPHPVKTDLRICVIAAPDSKAATEARSAGATLVGEDDIFAQIKAGVMDFDRILCHIDSLPKLNKAAVARVLGPRGLMPSTKTNTVVPTASAIGAAVRNLVGGSEYRERLAVIRMAVGQLGFTPEEMQRNVTAFMDALKKDIDKMKDRINKEIHEVVLSSTNAPGFTLNGDFRSANSIATKELAGPM